LSTQIRISGNKSLHGNVSISGAKNSSLPILAASLLTDEKVYLANVPMKLQDVCIMIELLKSLGKQVDILSEKEILVYGSVSSSKAPYHLVREMRASILALGPLLSKTGRANIPLPGGCNIGNRPVNLHIDGLKALGAEINMTNGTINGESKRLIGNRVTFNKVSVTGTQNLLMAATLAKGKTQIFNPANEPEVKELIDCLIMMGAKIKILPYCIEVEGVESLAGLKHQIRPDRIEMATYLFACMVTNGKITLNVDYSGYIKKTIDQLLPFGISINPNSQSVEVSMLANSIFPLSVSTNPYPGIATDIQPFLCVANSLAEGSSVIKETVFENRFQHLDELARLGSTHEVISNEVHFKGGDIFNGTRVQATDLRAGAALVLAGLAAKGETLISEAHHIFRGYESITEKLQLLGAEIELVN